MNDEKRQQAYELLHSSKQQGVAFSKLSQEDQALIREFYSEADINNLQPYVMDPNKTCSNTRYQKRNILHNGELVCRRELNK